jgi:GTP cyclohydrolase II
MYVADKAIRPQLRIRAEAPVPTRFGEFRMIVFHFGEPEAGSELSPDHVALVMGDVTGKQGVTCRVHSECLTSEVFGSLKCDCKEQLEAAQAEIARQGCGVVLYLRQEGRGIGLANKVRAYALQSLGHDTVDANRMPDLPDDAREYDGAAAMLAHLGVASIRLLTNNPLKVDAMRSLGVVVDERAPSIMRPNRFSRGYLEAKRRRMNHSLPPMPLAELPTAEDATDDDEPAPASAPRPSAGAPPSQRANDAE